MLTMLTMLTIEVFEHVWDAISPEQTFACRAAKGGYGPKVADAARCANDGFVKNVPFVGDN